MQYSNGKIEHKSSKNVVVTLNITFFGQVYIIISKCLGTEKAFQLLCKAEL